jgi:hypothetical protein
MVCVPLRMGLEERPSTTGSGTSVTGPDDFKAKIIGALRRLQKMPHIVRAFFADPDLRYITA